MMAKQNSYLLMPASFSLGWSGIDSAMLFVEASSRE
jgi:hypothetical protein